MCACAPQRTFRLANSLAKAYVMIPPLCSLDSDGTGMRDREEAVVRNARSLRYTYMHAETDTQVCIHETCVLVPMHLSHETAPL